MNRNKEEGIDQESIHQVLHLTQDALWESDKSTKTSHIQKRLEVSPFPADDHKATRPDTDRAICQSRTQINKKDPQKKSGAYMYLHVRKNTRVYN